MQPILNVRDVVELEAAIAERGVDACELMRRAGTAVALQAMREVEEGNVVVLCGMGNNGGDGWVAADYLAAHGLEVNVVTPAPPSLIRRDAARKAAQQACSVGVPVHVAPDYEELVALLVEADVVIDAVFGTGFHGEMGAPFDMWVEAVDDYFEGMLLSVDVPSGIDAATGQAEGPCFQADTTLTMFALKPGLIAGPGRRAAGQLVVASLVDDDEGCEELADAAHSYRLGEADYLDVLPERDEFADKYGHGRVLVVAGSTRFPGAAIMAAKAAARAGAGYVTLAVPAPVVPIAQTHLLSIPVVGLPAAPDGTFAAVACDEVVALAEKADCVLAGPGMGTSFGASEVVRALIGSNAPLVLDADALNIATKICQGNADEHPDALRREAPLVLTPHARELARLMGKDPASLACLSDLLEASQDLAWAVGSANFAVVAKGATSCVSCIEATLVPKAGPAALGTAGTGDVLAGIVCGLVAQQVCEFGAEEIAAGDLALLLAAALRIQARAADAAVKRLGSRGVIASDLIDLIGMAFDDVYAHAVLVANAEAPAGEDGELDDEPKMALDPEIGELITADAAMRAPEVPGEVHAYEGDLDEPEPFEAFEEQPADDMPAAQEAVDADGDDAAIDEPEESEEFEEPAESEEDEQAEEAALPEDAVRACSPAAIPADAVVRPAVRVDANGNPAQDAPASAASAPRKAKGVPAFLAAIGAAVSPKRAAESDVPAVAAAQAEQPDALGAASQVEVSQDAGDAAEPGVPCSTPGVPAFLSQVVQGVPVSSSASATTIMPALSLEDIARAQAAHAARLARSAQPAEPVFAEVDSVDEDQVFQSAAPERLSPDIEQRANERVRLDDFHERNSLHVGDDEVTPVQERPRARRVRRKK